MEKTAESVLISARENNEPVFVLRAKDQCSILTLLRYEEACKNIGCDRSHVDGIVNILNDFAYWRENHPEQVKIPD